MFSKNCHGAVSQGQTARFMTVNGFSNTANRKGWRPSQPVKTKNRRSVWVTAPKTHPFGGLSHPFSVKIGHVHQSMPADTSDLFARNKTYLSTCGFPTLLQVDAYVSEVLEGTRSLWAVPNIFVYLRFLCKTPGRSSCFRGTRRHSSPYLLSETYLFTCGFLTLLQVEAHVLEVLEGYLRKYAKRPCKNLEDEPRFPIADETHVDKARPVCRQGHGTLPRSSPSHERTHIA